MVAKGWKTLDPRSRRVFEDQAALDKQEYEQAMHLRAQQEVIQGGTGHQRIGQSSYRHLLSSASSVMHDQKSDVLTRLQQLMNIRELLEREMNLEIVEHAAKVKIDSDRRNAMTTLLDPLPIDSTVDTELLSLPLSFSEDDDFRAPALQFSSDRQLIDPRELDALFD